METNGGGWTVIQRRRVGLTTFDRDWKQYKKGFGTVRGDFWLGNEHIYRLTQQATVLRIEMEVRGRRAPGKGRAQTQSGTNTSSIMRASPRQNTERSQSSSHSLFPLPE